MFHIQVKLKEAVCGSQQKDKLCETGQVSIPNKFI